MAFFISNGSALWLLNLWPVICLRLCRMSSLILSRKSGWWVLHSLAWVRCNRAILYSALFCKHRIGHLDGVFCVCWNPIGSMTGWVVAGGACGRVHWSMLVENLVYWIWFWQVGLARPVWFGQGCGLHGAALVLVHHGLVHSHMLAIGVWVHAPCIEHCAYFGLLLFYYNFVPWVAGRAFGCPWWVWRQRGPAIQGQCHHGQ